LLAEAHLSAIVQYSDDAIISKSLDGLVVTWNPAASRIFGFSEDEMVGQSIRR
jgi:PAS domain S-box-containing protein